MTVTITINFVNLGKKCVRKMKESDEMRKHYLPYLEVQLQ